VLALVVESLHDLRNLHEYGLHMSGTRRLERHLRSRGSCSKRLSRHAGMQPHSVWKPRRVPQVEPWMISHIKNAKVTGFYELIELASDSFCESRVVDYDACFDVPFLPGLSEVG
jgi:hypothetical protein